MHSSSCQICESACDQIHAIPVADLVVQYRRQLGIDVAGEFNGLAELTISRCPRCDFTSFVPPIVGSVAFYDRLQASEWYYLADKPEFATARRFLRPDDRVLDVGCGSGAFARGHPSGLYLGLEYTAGAIALAEAKGLTVLRQSVEAYAAAQPPPHDIVCAFQVLEHVADQRAFINACTAVCRPGGRIIFSTPNADCFASVASNLVLNFPPHHTAWFSRRFWLELPRYFPVRLVEITEEPLEAVHVPFYASTLVEVSLRRTLGLDPPALINVTFLGRALAKVSRGIGALLARGLQDERLRPKGQAITAVYERC